MAAIHVLYIYMYIPGVTRGERSSEGGDRSPVPSQNTALHVIERVTSTSDDVASAAEELEGGREEERKRGRL